MESTERSALTGVLSVLISQSTYRVVALARVLLAYSVYRRESYFLFQITLPEFLQTVAPASTPCHALLQLVLCSTTCASILLEIQPCYSRFLIFIL